jgi:hypothetical protein
MADSREHLWPDWVLHSVGSQRPYVRKIGDAATVWVNDPEPKAKCVCEACNNGWMSDLESLSKKIIGPMLLDVGGWIDPDRQKTIARWSLKTAMVFESLTRSNRPNFYTTEECANVRLASNFPLRTSVWLGRFNQSGLGAWGKDIKAGRNGIPEAGDAYGTTFVVGKLIIQVVTLHVSPTHETVVSDLDPHGVVIKNSLVSIWPSHRTAFWPLPHSFSLNGRLPLSSLLHPSISRM